MPDKEEPHESSLAQLGRAFAAAMGRSRTTEAPVPAEDPIAPIVEAATEDVAEVEELVERVADDACPISPKTILEAILFVGHPENEPIQPKSVAKLLRGVDEDEIEELVTELNQDYESDNVPFRVLPDGNGFSLQLLEKFDHVRERFYGRMRQVRLSQLAIDVLAVVAYNQPVTREDVDKLLNNGVPSGRVLNQLVRRDLLARQTTDDRPKRKEFVTTERFLALFDLSEISDLPRSEDPQ